MVFPKNTPGDQGVIIRTVVTDKEHLPAIRDLVEVLKIVLYAHDVHADAGGGLEKKTVEFRLVVVFLFLVDEHGEEKEFVQVALIPLFERPFAMLTPVELIGTEEENTARRLYLGNVDI